MLKGIILGAVASLVCLDMACADPRIDFVYRPSSKNGVLYESRAFIPIVSNKNALLFGDIRGMSNFDTANEFNLGIGVRNYLADLDIVLGGYYFYDYRNQTDVYKQSTVGAEILGAFYEIRGNYYSPIDSSCPGPLQIGRNDSGVVTLDRIGKMSIGGYDAEVGFKMPVGNQDLWAYAGIYKFTSAIGSTNSLQGKKARLEFDFANSLSVGVRASIGAEYDYSDNKDKSGASVTFKIGIPFGVVNELHNRHGGRMMKSIVRDVDIRVQEVIASEYASARVIMSDGSEEKFDEVVIVDNETELYDALAGGDAKTKRAIMINDDMFLSREINIAENQKIINNNMDISYVGNSPEDIIRLQVDPYKASATISSFKIFEGLAGTTEVDCQVPDILYDGKIYGSIDFVSTEAEFRTAVAKNHSIVVMKNDLHISDEIVKSVDDTVVIGKGEISYQNDAGEIRTKRFENEQKMTTSKMEFEGTSVIFDGVHHIIDVGGFQHSNILEFRNGTIDIVAAYLYHGSKGLDQVYQNMTIRRVNGTGNLFYSGVKDQNVIFSDVKFELGGKQSSIVSGTEVTLAGDVYINYTGDYGPLWDESTGRFGKLNLREGAHVTITGPGYRAGYKINKDVVIGADGMLSPLSRKSISKFDLSNHTLTGLAEGDITRVIK